MEEHEQEEKKPVENWNGEERRQGGQGNYQGDERRKAEATGDLTGGNPGMSEEEKDQQEKS